VIIDDIYVAGTGSYIPPSVSSAEAVRRGWYDQELVDACGWKGVAVAGDVSAPDMAVDAVRQAFQCSGLDRDEIDILVHTHAYHQGPDGWSAPHYILRNTLDTAIPALTIGQGCNGFLAGIEMAAHYLRSTPSRSGAVVSSADNFGAPLVDRWRADRDAVLGDGAAAFVLSNNGGFARLLAIDSVSLPEFERLSRGDESLFPPAVTTGKKLAMRENFEAVIEELGPAAARIGQEYGASGAKLVHQVLGEARIGMADVVKVLHLAAGSHDFLASHLQPMGLDASLGDVDFFRQIGHIGASDIGLQLHHLLETGRLNVGDHLLMLSAGPGIMITAAVAEMLSLPDAQSTGEK
jgi:3-oxoacyl-[acyl-carrier-protein] synthase III